MHETEVERAIQRALDKTPRKDMPCTSWGLIAMLASEGLVARLESAADVSGCFAVPELTNWYGLAMRLRQYALAVSRLGGLNDLDKALHTAADGVEAFGCLSEDEQQGLLKTRAARRHDCESAPAASGDTAT